jgi:uncharacterized RDD family membrane protein YckC
MEIVLDGICTSCGNDQMADGRFCLFCGDLLAQPKAASQRKFAQVETAAPAEYAGFWLRLSAGAVDFGVEALGAVLLTLIIEFLARPFIHFFGVDPWDLKVSMGMAFIVIWAVGSWLYCAFMESSSWRATLGKRLFGLQVITIDGNRTSFGLATARHFMKFLSLFGLMIGFLMSGWTKRRQALHDIPCECLVVRVSQPRFTLLGH